MYIVCGHPRTGTSMMMQILIASGYKPVLSSARENTLQNSGSDEDFSANDVYYEPSPNQLQKAKEGQADGNLIKMVYNKLYYLPTDFKMVLMVRDSEEIRQSFDASFSKFEQRYFFNYKDSAVFEDEYNTTTKDLIEKYNPIVLDYNEVIKDPRKELSKITWPIDMDKACSIVNPDKYHFQLDKLVVGL